MNKHLFLPQQCKKNEQYNYPNGGGNNKSLRVVDRYSHGNKLKKEYENAIDGDELYIDIILTKDSYNVLSRLEEKGHVKISNIEEHADGSIKVTINKSDRSSLLKKIESYITENTPVTEKEPNGKPKNEPLIVSIDEIKKVTFESFWHGNEAKKFIDENTQHWQEVWLTTDSEVEIKKFEDSTSLLNIDTKPEILRFPDTTIKLIKASKRELEQLIMKSPIIGEYRNASVATSQYTSLENAEMHEYTNELLSRCTFHDSNVVVCVLDGGITLGHPLLNKVITEDDTYSLFGDTKDDRDNKGHGTAVSGLVVYGDLVDLFNGNQQIGVHHKIESVKFINCNNPHEPELYGDLTKRAAYDPIINKPNKVRVFFSTVTASKAESKKPSSWSSAIDQLTSEKNNEKLYIISAGNETPGIYGYDYPSSNITKPIEDPSQSWNAVTVGAYTNKSTIIQDGYKNYLPLADVGGLSPFSTTTTMWEDKNCPIKPDIVMEGGNVAILNGDIADIDDLKLLSTYYKYTDTLINTVHGTSAAGALAARYAAIIRCNYPNIWPETVRALMIHSAEWTAKMKENINMTRKGNVLNLMKQFGYGVPNIDKALNNLKSSLTLIAQETIQPYVREGKNNPKLNEMHIYTLPWPKDELERLGGAKVTMRITLSYFVDVSPRMFWSSEYQYQSFGLRFNLNSPTESIEQFKLRISKELDENNKRKKSGTPSASGYWLIGNSDKGSIHSDYWQGTASELAASNFIAVYPVSGWWKTLKNKGMYNNTCRYSLVISIHTEQEEIDIYTPVKTTIETIIQVPMEVIVNSES